MIPTWMLLPKPSAAKHLAKDIIELWSTTKSSKAPKLWLWVVIFTPTAEMFEDWDVEPTQEGFEEYVIQEFLDEMWWELSNKSANTPMDYVDLDTLDENIEFDWGEYDE